MDSDVNDNSNINNHEDPNEQIGTSKLFYKWVESIAERAYETTNVSDQIGDRGNQQVLPSLITDFLKIANTIPLWTSVMCRFYPFSPRISSSASVESNFNQLKNRIFKHRSLPISVEDFVVEHIRSNSGCVKLAVSKVR